MRKCSICGAECQPWSPNSEGWGNNAEPVNHGRCCDDCNKNVVIPMRMMRLSRGEDPRRVYTDIENLDGNYRRGN